MKPNARHEAPNGSTRLKELADRVLVNERRLDDLSQIMSSLLELLELPGASTQHEQIEAAMRDLAIDRRQVRQRWKLPAQG